MSGFGSCLRCGGAVERVGWDDVCFYCQDEEHREAEDACDEESERG